jgi:hypothetical protein
MPHAIKQDRDQCERRVVIATIPLISTNDGGSPSLCVLRTRNQEASARVPFRRMQARVNAYNGRARL